MREIEMRIKTYTKYIYIYNIHIYNMNRKMSYSEPFFFLKREHRVVNIYDKCLHVNSYFTIITNAFSRDS